MPFSEKEHIPFTLQSHYQPAGDQPAAIAALLKGLEDNERHQVLLGVTGSGKTFTIANLIAKTNRPTLIMAHNKTLAAQLYGEMRSFFPKNQVEYFVSYYDYYQPEAYVPASDTYIEKDASINEHIEQMRLSATKALLSTQDTIIVATVSAIYGLGDPETYLDMLLHIRRGERIPRGDILKRLVELQYDRNDADFAPGTYRVRGELVDIFPAEISPHAYRIQMFDDDIEQCFEIESLTGKVIRAVPRFTIYPSSHYVTPRSIILGAIDTIKDELTQRLEFLRAENKLVEAQRLEQRTKLDIEMMREMGYCTGIENYSRYLSGRKPGEPPPTLLDYCPPNTLLVIDEAHVTIPQIGAMYMGDRSRKNNLVEYGFRLPSAMDNRPLKFEEFENLAFQTIYVSATPGPYELEKAQQHIVEQVVRPTGLLDPIIEIKPATIQVDDLFAQIQERLPKNERILVTTLTKRMSEDLTDYLRDQGIRVRYLHSDIETVERSEILRDLRLGVFDVLVGINLLREGLDLPEVSLVAIFDADKEGFLRSARSLIQTIGRAARNVNGKAILYADKITRSMDIAIQETDRRRLKQQAFNEAHGITPQSIQKAVADVMEGARDKNKEISDSIENLDHYTIDQKNKLLLQLEKKMRQHAKSLEFEEAAQVRDQIETIKKSLWS